MTLLAILAIIAAVIGIIGSIVPGIPGPPVSWVGLLLIYLNHGTNAAGDDLSLTLLLVWLGVTIVVTVLDYVVPAFFTRVTGGHKAASVGAVIGLFAGMFIPPVGMILGSLIGAFLADFLIADNGIWGSFKASVGAFIGFLAGTGLKLIASAVMFYYIIIYL